MTVATSAGPEAATAEVVQLFRLGASPPDKAAAIAEISHLLVSAGCIEPAYGASMMRREEVANTYLGHGVAIPHGMVEDRALVRRNGIAIMQVPAGVEWNPGQSARLVVGIAAQSGAHITLLRRLTRLMQDEARLARLCVSDDVEQLRAALAEDGPEDEVKGAQPGDLARSFQWVMDYPSGLHARPASAWVEAARAGAARVQVRRGHCLADARSMVALLQLGLRRGDSVVVSSEGADAEAVLARMKAVITNLSIQEKQDAAKASRHAETAGLGWVPETALPVVVGLAASPGLAIAPLFVLHPQDTKIPDTPEPLAAGGTRLHQALTQVRQHLKVLADDAGRRLGASEGGIFKAQAELLNDTDLVTLACQKMVEGHGVAWSWHEAISVIAGRLAGLGNPILAERAADLRDVGQRVLGLIDPGLQQSSLSALPDAPCILVASDLSPSDTAGLDASRVMGLATAQGGPTSHTAILARTLGLPALVGGDRPLQELQSGIMAILDGQGGRLYLDPTEADLASARAYQDQQRRQREAEEAVRALPATTRDGHTVEIGANVNNVEQVAAALALGAEGVGLMRTEFLFLERGESPSEDQQAAIYTGMLDALDGRPLVVRALDIGGDKQVAHLHLPNEANPFLGVRGARLLLRRPDLLEPQLRALYRAAAGGRKLSIMFPMVTSLAEVEALRAVCERMRAEVAAEPVPLGIMVEVPAAALLADSLARHVDFFSIGTNDLTQYALAIDRQHPELAAEADSLHPAVLRLIRKTVEGAATHNRWVGVCGGIAGDPFGAALLTGLGVNELSMTPRDVPAVKARLRASTRRALRELAEKALECSSADEVRALDRRPS